MPKGMRLVIIRPYHTYKERNTETHTDYDSNTTDHDRNILNWE